MLFMREGIYCTYMETGEKDRAHRVPKTDMDRLEP